MVCSDSEREEGRDGANANTRKPLTKGDCGVITRLSRDVIVAL
jgi:hypothetical protein